MKSLELISALFVLVNVGLAARENIWTFPTGIIGVTLFSIVCFQSRLYASAGLQLVFFSLLIYGWYAWLRGGEQHGALRVHRTPLKWWPLLVLTGVVATVAIAWFTQKFEAALPYWDAAIAGFSVVAQWMMARKLFEHWFLWMAVDVIAIGTYWTRGLHFFAALYVVLFALCCWGVIEWRRSLAASA